jgi:hypothetical protein
MAVRLKYADLTYVKQPDARPLDLTSFREAGAAITAAADNLQERVIRNENAYNEMAIKMSEYNAIQGVDEKALAGKINETQEQIKAKVDEDGGWFFADTAVSDGARKFLTDEGIKTILSNKAQFDALMQQNEASDAPEEYKAANRAMILEKFNKAGGSLGGNGKQAITAFGTALGKGHDRSIYQKELLEMMKAWKADKRSVFNAKFIKDATDLMNLPGKGHDRSIYQKELLKMMKAWKADKRSVFNAKFIKDATDLMNLPGKGHDRSIYQKELLKMMKAWKADKRSVFNAKFIKDATDLMNLPGTSEQVQATVQKIIANRDGNLSGVLTRDSTIESITEDEIRKVFTAVLSAKPEFRTAMAKDATDLMNLPGTSEQVQATVQKIIANRDGNLSGVLTRDSTIESITEDEIRKVFTAVLSAKPEFRTAMAKDATDLMNLPGTSEQVQATVQKIIADRGGNLSGVLTRDSTIESVTEDEIREVFTAVLSAKPKFRIAMAKEAEIDKWLNSKQGGTNSSLVTNALKQYVATDPKMQHSMLSSSDFTKLTKKQQAIALQDPAVIQKYIDQGMANSMSALQQQPNESDEAYQARMGVTYNKIYTEQNISSLLNMAKIGAYTSVESKTDVKWFDNLLLDSLKAKREQLEKIKGQMTESIGFTRANLPGNAMNAVVDANIKTATEALDNAKATMAKYEDAEDDQSRYLYQQAEKSYIDAQNIIQQNNAIYDSMFRQLDGNNSDHSEVIEDTKAELLSYYRGDNKDELAAAIKSLKRPEDIINTFLRYGEGAELKEFRASLYYTGFIDKGKVDKSNLTRYFLTAANNVGIKPQTTPITLFTPISNNKAAFSDALDSVARLLEDNTGIWNFATASLGDDPENAKFLEKVIGMPLTSSEDFKDIFSSRKSGSGNNAVYQMSARNLSIGSDATGRLYLKVTIPAQGDNQVPREAILYTDDDGANMALRDAMRKGAQCSYNQAMTNPYDAYQRQTANEIMAFSGNIEPLGADLSRITNPQERFLNRFNTIGNQMVSNVSQALDVITNDTNIDPRGNYYPITSGDFKYNITKHPSGTYSVNVQKYNPALNRYVNIKYAKGSLNYSFADNVSLRNNLPALIYKLNHGNELKENFIPTQYLTPQQKSAYDVSYWSDDSLMLK